MKENKYIKGVGGLQPRVPSWRLAVNTKFSKNGISSGPKYSRGGEFISPRSRVEPSGEDMLATKDMLIVGKPVGSGFKAGRRVYGHEGLSRPDWTVTQPANLWVFTRWIIPRPWASLARARDCLRWQYFTACGLLENLLAGQKHVLLIRYKVWPSPDTSYMTRWPVTHLVTWKEHHRYTSYNRPFYPVDERCFSLAKRFRHNQTWKLAAMCCWLYSPLSGTGFTLRNRAGPLE